MMRRRRKTMSMMKKGMTMMHVATVIIIAALVIALALYLRKEKPETLQEIVGEKIAGERPVQRETRVGEIVAAYEAEYDSSEYCYDDEIYDLRCEDRCGPGGEVVEPKIAFADCRPPKRCCRYAPEEWPVFDEPPEGMP
jgi:hypothetical protein